MFPLECGRRCGWWFRRVALGVSVEGWTPDSLGGSYRKKNFSYLDIFHWRSSFNLDLSLAKGRASFRATLLL